MLDNTLKDLWITTKLIFSNCILMQIKKQFKLYNKCYTFNPKDRITVEELLANKYFNKIRNKELEEEIIKIVITKN